MSSTIHLPENYLTLPNEEREVIILESFKSAIFDDLELYRNPPVDSLFHIASNTPAIHALSNHLSRTYPGIDADLENVLPKVIEKLEEQIEALGVY